MATHYEKAFQSHQLKSNLGSHSLQKRNQEKFVPKRHSYNIGAFVTQAKFD